jgi:hypothetical protein
MNDGILEYRFPPVASPAVRAGSSDVAIGVLAH